MQIYYSSNCHLMLLDCLGGKRSVILPKAPKHLDGLGVECEPNAFLQHPGLCCILSTSPPPTIFRCMFRISCIAYATGCLPSSVSYSLSLSLFAPSTGFSHLLDTLVRPCPARSQSRYLLGSQPLSSPPAGPSAMPGTAYTSVGFKSVSTTQIKAQHSRTSVSPFYSIWCSVYWQTADGATCLPPSRHNPIPSTTVSILESCRRRPLSAAEMIAGLSGCDLFMLPIKLISPHIVVKA